MCRNDPFLIHIDELPKAGLDVDCELPEGWLIETVPQAYRPVKGNGTLHLEVRRQEDTLQVVGSVGGNLQFECSRCGAEAEKEYKVPVSVLFVPSSRHKVRVDPEFGSDEVDDIYPYDGLVISVAQPFIDALTSSVGPYPVCSNACKGLCPSCGADLNRENCRCTDSTAGPARESKEPVSPAEALERLREKFHSRQGH